MLNDRITAAKDVAAKLFALEAAIDEALVCAAAMTIAMPAARARAKVAATVGHEATVLTGEALSSLLEARTKIVSAHSSLADVRDEMGLRTYAGGALWKIVPEKGKKTGLQIVSALSA